MKKLVFALILFAAAAGCQQPLPDRAIIDNVRILAVRAEPPEAQPGVEVTFDALVVDPTGEGRPLELAWALCTPGDGGVASCGDPARVLALGTSLRALWVVPPSILDALTPAEAEEGLDVFVVLAVEAGDAGVVDASNPHDIAFKRVRISSSATPNRNPGAIDLTLNGGASFDPILVDAGTLLDVKALASTGSMETYLSSSGASLIEDARFTWSITQGAVDAPVSFGDSTGLTQNHWRTPEDPKDEPNGFVWVVQRDGRGGTSWASQPIILR